MTDTVGVDARIKHKPVIRVLASAKPVMWRLLLAAVLGAMAIGSSVGLLATSAFLISKAALEPPILHLQVAIVGVRAFGIGRGVFRYAERVVGHDAAFRSLSDLRVAVYDRLATIAPAGSGLWRPGDLLSRLVSDVDSMVNLYLRVLLPYLAAVLVSIGSVLLVATFVPAAAAALAAALLVGGVLVPILTYRLSRRTQETVAPALGTLSAETVTLVDGCAELIALGRQDDAIARIRTADEALTRAARRASASAGLGAGIGVLAQGLAVIAALVAGTQAVNSGALDGINLALVVLVPLAAYEAVQVLPAAALSLAQVRQSARRIAEVIDAPNPAPDPDPAQDLPSIPESDSLRIADLSVGWAVDQWVVRGLSLNLNPGRPVALMGRSGSGKTSVAMALARLAPSQGSIRYDDADLGALTGDDVRRIITIGLQDTYLFDTSILENIRLANRTASDDRIVTALQEVDLWDWVEQLPDGLNTQVGRLGRRVSGGQQQRLGIARILVGEHPVVIVDEPTEFLDPGSANSVMSALLAHCTDRCLLVLTHSPTDAEACTEVIQLPEPDDTESGIAVPTTIREPGSDRSVL